MKSRFLLSVMALLGVSSCVKPSENNLCMYGTPIEDFVFKGKLTDAEGNPIKGIAVQVKTQDAVTSNEDGTFSSEFSDFISGHHSVTFTDEDGIANGGEFATKRIDVSWEDAEEQGDKEVYDLGAVILDKKEK